MENGFNIDPEKSLGDDSYNLDLVHHEWDLPKFNQQAEVVLASIMALHQRVRCASPCLIFRDQFDVIPFDTDSISS